MLNYIEYLNIPAKMALVLVIVFFAMQIIGELLEFKGKVVPEFLKIRKYFERKRKEREVLRNLPSTLSEIKMTIDDFNSHYSNDNITKRDGWIKNVDCTLKEHENWAYNHEDWAKIIAVKLDRVIDDVLVMRIEDMRSAIINFAAYVIDETKPVTREQFNRIFKIHADYEEVITKNGKTNGEVDVAFHIITEAYENHLKNHTFIEDIRGYKTTI